MTGLVAKEEPDLALSPEMWLTGYTLRDRVIELAEPADGPYVEAPRKASMASRCTLPTAPMVGPDVTPRPATPPTPGTALPA